MPPVGVTWFHSLGDLCGSCSSCGVGSPQTAVAPGRSSSPGFGSRHLLATVVIKWRKRQEAFMEPERNVPDRFFTASRVDAALPVDPPMNAQNLVWSSRGAQTEGGDGLCSPCRFAAAG